MSLPNPGLDAVPFTALTAEFVDDMNENIEALADGSGLDDYAVASIKLADELAKGWLNANDTWAYASFSSGVGTITVASGAASKYSPGMKIRISQSTGGTKYGIITKIDSTTVIRVYFGTDYTLNNEAISSPYYSTQRAPFGFPLDPSKWTVSLTSSTGRSTTNASYTNLVDAITIPIGVWNVSFRANIQAASTGGGTTGDVVGYLSLSSSGTTETNPELTITHMNNGVGGSAETSGSSLTVFSVLTLTSSTTFTMIGKSSGSNSNVEVNAGSIAPTYIKAVCAYL